MKELCRELLSEHGSYRGSIATTSDSYLRLTGRHSLIPLSEIKGAAKSRRCHLCHHNVNVSARKTSIQGRLLFVNNVT